MAFFVLLKRSIIISEDYTRFPARAVGDPHRPRDFSSSVELGPWGAWIAPRETRKSLVSAVGVRALQPTRKIVPTRFPPPTRRLNKTIQGLHNINGLNLFNVLHGRGKVACRPWG